MKLRLAVIYGSRACEHDVSIISALQAFHAADREKYDVFNVYISREGDWYVGEALNNMAFYKKPDFSLLTRVRPSGVGGKLLLSAFDEKRGLFHKQAEPKAADVVLTVLHGMNGEDGTLQGMLEMWSVPYTSTGVMGSSVGMDKIAMKALFRGYGFPVLESVMAERNEWFADKQAVVQRVEEALDYPVYVKPANLGSSIGISRADDRTGLESAIDVASAYDRRILVERGVKKLREINCAALGYGSEVIVSETEMPSGWEEFLTFDDKYLRGKGAKGMENLKRKIPAPVGDEINARVKKMTAEIFTALDCKGVVRIDYILDDETGELFVGEINTIPGSLAFYLWEAVGIKFDELIDKLVEYALRAADEKKQSVFSYDSSILERGGYK